VDSLTPRLAELLTAYGPWLLFCMAVLETSFVTGLVVPSGLATALATVLALQGDMALRPLVVAAVVGGAVGDSLGFWIGRAVGARVFSGRGRWGELAGGHPSELGVWFGRHPLTSVTLARLVSFVRTVMPMAAGMSDLRYRRFLSYDLPGVLAWGGLYVGIGYVARESWRVATQILGVGGALAMGAFVVFLWWSVRGRVRRSRLPARGDAR